MAKTSGPLFSLTASGALAKTIVYSIWKGRPYVRELVTPSNPRTAEQQTTRYGLGIIAKAATAVLTSFAGAEHIGSEFFQSARDNAPSGQSWISWMQKVMNSLVTDGAVVNTAFAALSGTKQGYFDTAAASAGLLAYTPVWFSGGTSEVATNGGQLYALAYFAANYLTGNTKDKAELALDPADQGAVDDFLDTVNTELV